MFIRNLSSILASYLFIAVACSSTSEEKSNTNQESSDHQTPEEPTLIREGESRLPHPYLKYSFESSANNPPENGEPNEEDLSFWTFCYLATPPILDSIAIVEMLPQEEENLLITPSCENRHHTDWYNFKIRVWAVVAGEELPYDFQVFGVSSTLVTLNPGDMALATFVKYEENWYDYDVLKIYNQESSEINPSVPLPTDFEALSQGVKEHRQHWRERCTSDIELNRIRTYPDKESFRKKLYWETAPDDCAEGQR